MIDLSYLEDEKQIWMSIVGSYENGYADGRMAG